MKHNALFLLMLLAMASALFGQDVQSLRRKGEDALASGLWEIAILHFNECLANRTLSAADKSQVAIRLAEAWIRDGKPDQALALLDQSFVSQDPEVAFWKGHALAGLGRFLDAIDVFAPMLDDPRAPHRHEAGFTMASLQLSLAHPDEALATLARLTSAPDEALAAKARLHQVEILLDMGRPVAARQAMPAPATISPKDRMLATLLEAHLLLSENRPADASVLFQSLVDHPQGQSLYRFHSAAIGLSDALSSQASADVAARFLLSFIPEHPDSPFLKEMFQRLLGSLPDSPEPTHPVLERLAQWIPPSELTAPGAINILECSAASAWPTATSSNELLAFSLYTRAMGLHRVTSPLARAEARRLLTRLRLENPNNPLASRALFQTARWALDEGTSELAFASLDTLRETASLPMIRGEAAFLEARSAYAKGDKKLAIQLFDEAAASLAADEANTARLNAAILRLPDSASTSLVLQPALAQDRSFAADLELERALSITQVAESKKALEEFLTNYPEHPRLAEARLAAAEAALAGPQPDIPFARVQIDALTASPDAIATLDASRVAMVKLRIDDLAKDPATAIATAKSILEQYAGRPAAAEAALVLGRNLFQTRNYNNARLVLEKLAVSDTDPGRAQAAGLMAARSAALVPTIQSQQEALILFDKVIESKGSLASIAILEKARLMIDMNRLVEVSTFLRAWFDSLEKSDPLHLPAGFLLGEAIYAQGNVNPTSLTEALAVYDQLLSHTEQQPAVFNRLQYLRGRTLEQITNEKDPAQKRDKEAFIAYYSVLETANPPAEWHYFELCGFRALALLEKAARWPTAIACAKKIASFNGPRAAEASARASQLQLQHMIWED